MQKDRNWLKLMMEMSKTTRCCQHETVICENLTFNQFYILDLIAENQILKLSDLQDLLSVEKSTSTRLVDPLVKRGMVVREKSEVDYRAINLKLTRHGEEVHHDVREGLLGFVDSIENEIPEDKREMVYEGIKLFLKALKNTSCCR